MARVERSSQERQQRQEEIDNREANWRSNWQEWNRNRTADSADSAEFDQLLADFERYGGDWDDAVIDQWTTDDGLYVQRIDGDGDGKADVIRVLLADGTVQYRYDSNGNGKADRVVVPGHGGILTVHTDSDGDGSFDQVEVRDAEGNVLSSTVHADTDGDGAVDQTTVTTPESVTVHTDTDGDGAFDTVEVRDAEGNVLSSTVHADTDGDGAVDQATVTTPESVTVHTDRDGDGTFDQVEVRDNEGNVLSSTVHADTDGDGAVDQATVTTPESVTVHTDRDGDGTFDQVEVRDNEGNVLSSTVHADTDGDGAVDQATVTTPEGVTVHTDRDGDGTFDTVEVRDAEGNVLSSTVHADTDGDGAVDQATVTTPEGVTVHTDSDGDGTFDTVEVRDAEGNVLSSTVHADTDRDGAVDQATVTTPDGVRVHTDRDGDGTFDTVEVRDAEGNVLSSTVHTDTDGDGAVDQATITTPDGVQVHTDRDGDGTFDTVEVRDAEGNVLSRTVRADTDGDGAVDQVEVRDAEGNVLSSTVHTDTDGDGAVDLVEVRDAEGNVLSSTVHADTDGDGAVDQTTVTTPDGVQVHTDSDGDGSFDTVEVRDAEGNVLSGTVHADTDGDGAVDQATVTTPEGVTVHTDSDGDGSFDQVEVRDAEGNVLSSTVHTDTDGDGAVDQTTVTTPEGVRVRTDRDGDGSFDTLEVRDAEGNVLSHTVHADTDGDGAVDQVTVTTPEGVRVHTDSDGDGTIDYVPEAGSASDAVDLFALNDSGSKPPGRLTREQGTGNWFNASLLDDDSGINLVGPSYAVGENTIIADGTVSINGSEARVQTTYTRNPDGTITMQSRVINYYKDDAPGGGGGGGGSSRDYTVAADGTVSYTENGHTYTVSDDDLAQAVRDAVASGDASGLSSVDTTTVTNSDGQVMAYSLSRTDAINTVAATARGVFNPYQPTANNGTPHPESGQPVYFDGAGNAFYDAGLSNPVDDQAQMYFDGMLDTDRDGVPDSQDGVAGSMGNEFTVEVPDRFLPDAVRPAIPTFGDVQANAAALPAAAAARGIDTTGLSTGDISQKVFIHDQTAFVEQFLGPDAVPDGQAPTREQLAQAQEMYDAGTTFGAPDDDVASLNAQDQGFTIGMETSGGNYDNLRAAQEAWFREQLAEEWSGRPDNGNEEVRETEVTDEIRATNLEVLEIADQLGIGYDPRHPDFDKVRRDIARVNAKNQADYENDLTEAADQLGIAYNQEAPDYDRLRTEVGQEILRQQLAADESVTTAADQLGIAYNQEAPDYDRLRTEVGQEILRQQLAADESVTTAADQLGIAYNQEAPDYDRLRTEVGQEIFRQQLAADESVTTAADQLGIAYNQEAPDYDRLRTEVEQELELQQRAYNAAAGVDAGGVGDAAVQAGIEQQRNYNAVLGVDAGGVGDAAVQAGIEQQRAADERAAGSSERIFQIITPDGRIKTVTEGDLREHGLSSQDAPGETVLFTAATERASQGETLILREVEPKEEKSLFQRAAEEAMSVTFGQHALQASAGFDPGTGIAIQAIVGGPDTQFTAADLASDKGALAQIPKADRDALLHKYGNPLTNPYTRTSMIVLASGATLPLAGVVPNLAAGAVLGGVDLTGQRLQYGKLSRSDYIKAGLWELAPFSPAILRGAGRGIIKGHDIVQAVGTGSRLSDIAVFQGGQNIPFRLRNLVPPRPQLFTKPNLNLLVDVEHGAGRRMPGGAIKTPVDPDVRLLQSEPYEFVRDVRPASVPTPGNVHYFDKAIAEPNYQGGIMTPGDSQRQIFDTLGADYAATGRAGPRTFTIADDQGRTRILEVDFQPSELAKVISERTGVGPQFHSSPFVRKVVGDPTTDLSMLGDIGAGHAVLRSDEVGTITGRTGDVYDYELPIKMRKADQPLPLPEEGGFMSPGVAIQGYTQKQAFGSADLTHDIGLTAVDPRGNPVYTSPSRAKNWGEFETFTPIGEPWRAGRAIPEGEQVAIRQRAEEFYPNDPDRAKLVAEAEIRTRAFGGRRDVPNAYLTKDSTGPVGDTRPSATAMVFDPDQRAILMVQGGYGKNRKGKWQSPGGLIDAGEDGAKAALRETTEETGVVGKQSVKVDQDQSVNHEVWAVQYTKGNPAVQDHETLDVRWVPFDEVKNLDLAFPETEGLALDNLRNYLDHGREPILRVTRPPYAEANLRGEWKDNGFADILPQNVPEAQRIPVGMGTRLKGPPGEGAISPQYYHTFPERLTRGDIRRANLRAFPRFLKDPFGRYRVARTKLDEFQKQRTHDLSFRRTVYTPEEYSAALKSGQTTRPVQHYGPRPVAGGSVDLPTPRQRSSVDYYDGNGDSIRFDIPTTSRVGVPDIGRLATQSRGRSGDDDSETFAEGFLRTDGLYESDDAYHPERSNGLRIGGYRGGLTLTPYRGVLGVLGETPGRTPFRTPPETPPGTPPETPPGIPPETPPGIPPETPPGIPPETPPGIPPETPPGTPPETPPGTPPETPPWTPPETPPGTPPETPPGTPPEMPPGTPPETPPGIPPETPPGIPPETPPGIPPETPPGIPPETPPGIRPGPTRDAAWDSALDSTRDAALDAALDSTRDAAWDPPETRHRRRRRRHRRATRRRENRKATLLRASTWSCAILTARKTAYIPVKCNGLTTAFIRWTWLTASTPLNR